MNFDFQPSLQGTRLKLRPLLENDFEALCEVASDPLIWEQHPQKNRYIKEIFRSFFENAIQSKGAFIILNSQTNEVLGSTRYYEPDPSGKFVFIGYTFLARKCWGGIFNQELKKLMLDHAFRFVPEVRFHIGEKNTRSRKAVEKIGGILIDSLVDVQKYGDDQTRMIYSIKKDQ